jgi:hypothetical protein
MPGSARALAAELDLPYSRSRIYLLREAMPPEESLVRAVEIVLDALAMRRREHQRRPGSRWRAASMGCIERVNKANCDF